MTIRFAGAGGCDSIFVVTAAPESLPSDLAAAHAMILAERAARIRRRPSSAMPGRGGQRQADLTSSEALIAHLKLQIEKLRRELYGTRSERKARLLDQMELSWRSWRRRRARTNGPRRRRRADAAVRPVRAQAAVAQARSRSICRASASSSPRRRAAPAAVRHGCRSSARTSPRRWR